MSLTEKDRLGETLEWFLYREKVYSSRDEAIKAIIKGDITINDKIVKNVKYIPKKDDVFIISSLKRNFNLSY